MSQSPEPPPFHPLLPRDGMVTPADLLTFAAEAGRLVRMLPELVTPVVVDANVLLEDLLRCAQGRRVALPNAAMLGSGRLHVTPSVLAEVREHLPRVAGGRDRAQLQAVLESTYLPWLRVVDVGDVEIADGRLDGVAERDPDDVDTARLALVLAPSCLLTRDGDLLENGLGVIFDPAVGRAYWTLGAVALESQGLLVGVVGGAGMAASLAGAVVPDAARAAGRLLADDRAVLAGIVVLLGAALLLAAFPQAGARVEAALAAVSGAAGAAARGLGTVLAWAAEARELLDATAVRAVHPPTPRDAIARTLATGVSGLTVAEIESLLPAVEGVGHELRRWRMFVEVAPGVWSLGRPAGGVVPA